MSDSPSACGVIDDPDANADNSTGLSPVIEHTVAVRPDRRPLSAAWVSDELLARTMAVWTRNYGRPVDEDEALEILMNVKQLGEVLLRMRTEGETP